MAAERDDTERPDSKRVEAESAPFHLFDQENGLVPNGDDSPYIASEHKTEVTQKPGGYFLPRD